eukprot:gene8247-5768_t
MLSDDEDFFLDFDRLATGDLRSSLAAASTAVRTPVEAPQESHTLQSSVVNVPPPTRKRRRQTANAPPPSLEGVSAPAVAEVAGTTTENGIVQIQCPRCTYLNRVGSITCEMCDWGIVCVPPVVTVEQSETVAAPLVASPVSTQKVTPEDSDTEEEEVDRSSDSDISDAGSSGEPESDTLDYDNQELVSFLQHLDSHPPEDLPLADVPLSMQEHGSLRPFQLQGLHWLLHREDKLSSSHTAPAVDWSGREDDAADLSRSLPKVRGGILADFMGLGKTRTMIALCEATRRPHHRLSNVSGSEVVSPATLIVAPPSLILQWMNEIRASVSPTPRILHYYGNKRRKMSFIQIAEKYDYVIVSYQTLRAEAFPRRTAAVHNVLSEFRSSRMAGDGSDAPLGHLFMIRWQRIILDEAHYIRNARSKLSQSCFLLHGSSRWAVTATPIQNNVNDAFTLFRFLGVPFFGNRTWWNQEIISYLQRDPLHPRATTALRMAFAALSLRRTPSTKHKGVPILQLPPIDITTMEVDLSKEEREFYDSIYAQASNKVQDAANNARRSQQYRVFQTAFEMLIRCRQACLHPYIVAAALAHLSLIEDESNSSEDGNSERNSARWKERMEKFITTIVSFLHVSERRAKNVQRNSSEFVQELISELREQKLQERECLICLENIARPAILPCGHTFCDSCISHAFDADINCCPLCKTKAHGRMLLVPKEFLSSAPVAEKTDASHPTTGVQQTAIFKQARSTTLTDYSSWPSHYSNKTQQLVAYLRTIPPGEKCVVFSSFLTYLKYLKQYLDTQTDVASDIYSGLLTIGQKNNLLQRFASNETETAGKRNPTVLLATIMSSGVGLNLVAANHVFMMDPLYNPGMETQTIHRVHRMGQERPVRVIKMIAKDTIERKIDELCKAKAAMSGYCFESAHVEIPLSRSQGRLRTAELVALFAPETTPPQENDSTTR